MPAIDINDAGGTGRWGPGPEPTRDTSWRDRVDAGSRDRNDREQRSAPVYVDPRLSIGALVKPTDPVTIEHGRIEEILSNGPIEGLVFPNNDPKKAMQSVYLDGTPVQNSDGSWNYDGVYFAMSKGTATQAYVPGFGGVEYEDVSSNREIKQASPVTVTVSDTAAHAARIKVSTPALFDGENGTRVDFKIELQATGEPVNNGWNVIFGPAAQAKSAGVSNTLGFSINGPAKTVTRDEGNFLTDGFMVGMQVRIGGMNNPANQKVFTLSAVTATVVTLSSDDAPVTESYTNGCSMVTVGNAASIIGEFNAKYVKGFLVSFNGLKGPWNIRVTKITADSASTTVQRSLYFESVTTIKRVKQNHPLTAVMKCMMDSRKIQRVPSRSFLIKGRIVRVPMNYDPITRVYATTGPGTTGGVWDGTFKEAWTDNPAWVFLDMASNNLYGCGQYLSDTNLGVSALYLISQYCDQLVPDGKGGTEPRFRLTANISTQQDAMKLLNTIASVFRGAAYYYGDKVYPTQDSPASSVALFTASNVKDGKFSYTSTAKKARHTAAVVTWADPANRFAKTQEYVEDTAGVARYGLNITEFTSFGCIYQGQARRDGLWALATELMSTEVVTFETADEGIVMRPNDIFTVSDGARWGKRMGGRVLSAPDASTVQVDSPITFEVGHTYTLSVKLPSGALETRSVTNVLPSTSDTLTVSSPFSSTAQVEGQWILTDTGILFPIDYRLISVEEVDDNGALTHKITGLLYSASKFDTVEQGLAIRPFEYPAQYFAQAPSNVTASELIKLYGSIYGAQLRVAWDAIDKADYYVAFYSKDLGPWEKLSLGTASAFLDNAPLGNYRVRVAAHYPNGRLSTYTEAEYTVKGTDGLEAPDSPTNLAAFAQESQLWLYWTPPATDTFGVLVYEVRWGQTWESAQFVGRTSDTKMMLPSDGVYWVAAMQFKKYSAPVSIVVGSVAFQRNVVETFDEKALNWPGTKTAGMSSDPVIGLYLSSTTLFEDATGNFDDAPGLFDYYGGVVLEGTYTPPPGIHPAGHTVDLGQLALCTITCRYTLTAVSTSDSFDNIPDIDTWPDIDGSVGNTATILIEIRTSQDGSTWGDWMPYSPGMKLMLWMVQYRITLRTIDPQVYPVLSAFEITIDMPDRTEQAQGEAISAAGKTVTFAKKFQEKPVTHITMIDAALGSYYKLTGESTTGFTVTLYNASNVAIAGTINRSSRGY